jgi:hypothetical protein
MLPFRQPPVDRRVGGRRGRWAAVAHPDSSSSLGIGLPRRALERASDSRQASTPISSRTLSVNGRL